MIIALILVSVLAGVSLAVLLYILCLLSHMTDGF